MRKNLRKNNNNIPRKAICLVSLIFMLFCFTGCESEELLSGLDSKQAIEVLVVLNQHGIAAERVKEASGRVETYNVTVEKADYRKSLKILHDFGLPKKTSNDLKALTEGDRFVPHSQQMIEFKRDLAISMQVERLVKAIGGVVDVRAVVRSPVENKRKRSKDKILAPKASIVVRYIDEGSNSITAQDIKSVVAQSVPNLSPANVIVRLNPVKMGTTSIYGIDSGETGELAVLHRFDPFFFRVPESEASYAREQLAVALLIFGVLGVLVGIYFGNKLSQRKKGPRVNLGGQPDPGSFYLAMSVKPEEGKEESSFLDAN